jgi:hypothetical protein
MIGGQHLSSEAGGTYQQAFWQICEVCESVKGSEFVAWMEV